MRKPLTTLPSTRTIRIKRTSCNREQETLLSEIAELKVPLTEVQEDLKKLRDIRYWVRKATPGTEESKEPPKKQPIKKSCRIRLTRKKHKEPPRHRRNTDNRIWNFNRHLPFSIRECQVLFLFSRRDRFRNVLKL